MQKQQKEQIRQFTWWAYVLLCFVGTVVVMFKKGDAVIFALGDWTDTISDPVLQPALKLLLIALGVVLLPGIIAILLAFGAFLIAFVIIPVLLFQGVAWLASVSPPTAVIAVLALSAGIGAVVHNNRIAIRKAWLRVSDITIDAVAWGVMAFRRVQGWEVFFSDSDSSGGNDSEARMDEKEATFMDESENTKEETEQAEQPIEKHSTGRLETILPASPEPGLWGRIRNRSVQKDNEEIIKIMEQQGRGWAEASRVYEEQARALEAKDNLERVRRGDTKQEKDEEAEIRQLKRKKELTELKREIAETELSDKEKFKRYMSKLALHSKEAGRRHADKAHEAQEFMRRCEAVRKEVEEDKTIRDESKKQFSVELDTYEREGVKHLLQGTGLNHVSLYEDGR